jgi:uncharacterized membrane protein
MNPRVWRNFAVFISLACAALVYFFAPERVPILFDSSGKVTHFEPKSEIVLGNLWLIGVLGAIWLATQTQSHNRRFMELTFGITVALVCALQVLMILPFLVRISTGDAFLRAAFSAVAMSLVLVGNFAPKLEPSAFAGVQNPYCFASRKAWFATNRMAGRGMVGLGLGLMLFAVLLPSPLLLETLLVILIGTVLLGYIALWFYSKSVYLSDSERRPLDSPFEW